ncbi:MAG: 4Fe-4S binding protein [Spirochaetales bacterium]|jgi:iron only hydrogenase large subunit-like protein|nr:4Fe-4S binding protein [Spirochaetales bacterium]
MAGIFHSVKLNREKCKGCTTCLGCPTEAIRVRNGKAAIVPERCIDCGLCIRVCPYHAKEAQSDSLDDFKRFDFRVALPAPALYGQFNPKITVDKILAGLIKLGFDDVFEVASAAEIAAVETRRVMAEKKDSFPLISSSCPAIVRLIQLRFPGLLDQVLRVESPMEIAARIVRQEIYPGKKNLGIFFISPCPAKITAVKNPLNKPRSEVDGIIPIKDIYLPLLASLSEVDVPEKKQASSFLGISWAVSQGEGDNVGGFNIAAVDGILNAAKMFEEMENRRLRNVDFIEAMACPGGCVGGPLTVENPYIAKARIRNKALELSSVMEGAPQPFLTKVNTRWLNEDLKPRPIQKLDDNFQRAIEMMDQMEKLATGLPGLDCGACGAPSCRALAEDIVRGTARKNDCIFVLREEIRSLSINLAELGAWVPQSMKRDNEE